MKTKYLLLFLAMTALGLLFFYTKAKVNKTANAPEVTEEAVEMPSDFLDFYNEFHTDSTFQKAHINFPLKGIKALEETGGGEDHMYTSDEWIVHKPFDDMDGTFTRSFEEFGGIVAETIIANGGQFRSLRRFAKLGDEWHLIFYQPMGMY